jgi:glycosyltransferase involved in cell wall biosynthesis
MNLLVVMQRYPWPPRTGGTQVAYNSIKELAKRHSVSMICLERPACEGDLAAVLEDLWFPDGAAVVRRSKLAKLLLMCRGVPSLIWGHASRPMELAVAGCADRFDALILFELHAIQYCPVDARQITVANIEDPPSIKFRLYSQLSVFPSRVRVRFRFESWLLARYEKRVLPGLAKVLLLSEADTKLMRAKGGHVNLGNVPYGTTDAWDAENVTGWNERTPGAIIFSGNMWHEPNVDAVLFFLRDIFPLVLRQAPSARLWIVGANPDARIGQAAEHFPQRVLITGQVPDIAEYVSRARVSICPVRVRVGVQTKILEAMSVGTPIVSTSAGNAGIGGVSGRHLWVADDPAQFACRVVDLLHGNGWSRMSDEGLNLVRAEFNWKRSTAALEEHLSQIPRSPLSDFTASESGSGGLGPSA